MRRETLIAVIVAVVLGGIAVYLANSYLLGAERQRDANELTRVAVAAVPIEFGTELTPEKVRFAAYPRSSLPPGSFANNEALFPKGERRVALTAMSVNEPILSGKISGSGVNASIAALLPNGMRAASVRINDVSGVAGFVQPNDSVDVLITRQFSAGGGQQITDVLLQDVRVIAIGQRARNTDGKPISARNATLQVDPLGAQKLALAQEIGSLSLVLRKPGETEDTPFVSTVSLEDLRYGRFSSQRVPSVNDGAPTAAVQAAAAPRVQVARAPPRPRPAAPPRAAAPAKPKTNSVEVVRGTTGNQYEVGGYGS